MTNKMKPGIKTIIAGAGLFIFGIFIIPLLFILPVILEKSDEVQFKVPGTQEVTVEKPGRYYLWNDYQIIFNGKSYGNSKSLPDGMEIKIQDVSGAPISFISNTSISSTLNSSAANSIGYVEMTHANKVKITVTGGNEERIFSFKRSMLARILGLILGGIGLSGLVTLTGLIIGVWGIIKLVRSNQRRPA